MPCKATLFRAKGLVGRTVHTLHRRSYRRMPFLHLLYYHRRILGRGLGVFFEIYTARSYIDVDDILISIIIHLNLFRVDAQSPYHSRLDRKRTSSDNFEFPQPSISIRDLLFGMTSLTMCAISAYDLNQSKAASFFSLHTAND